MKKMFLILIIINIIFLPLNVSANIMCNDGTISSSCSDCHRGCCSRHGGCGGGGYVQQDSSSTYNHNSTITTPNSKQGEAFNYNNSKSINSTGGYVQRSYDPDKNKSDTPWWGYIVAFFFLYAFIPTGGNKKRRRR